MDFPRYVYKLGTGVKLNDSGLCAAESLLVASAEALALLGAGWVDSPAAAVAPEPKHEAKAEEKPAKIETRLEAKPEEKSKKVK